MFVLLCHFLLLVVWVDFCLVFFTVLWLLWLPRSYLPIFFFFGWLFCLWSFNLDRYLHFRDGLVCDMYCLVYFLIVAFTNYLFLF